MASRPYKTAMAITGEYTDRQSGETKKRYTRMGTLLQSDDGKLSLKLDAIPAGRDWDGWVSFFDIEPRQGT